MSMIEYLTFLGYLYLLAKREAQSAPAVIYNLIIVCYNPTVTEKILTLEWRLPQGAGGMAAQMVRARLRSKLAKIAEQHGFHCKLYHSEQRYRVRVDLGESQYTVLALQWQATDSWDQWTIVK